MQAQWRFSFQADLRGGFQANLRGGLINLEIQTSSEKPEVLGEKKH